jgi:hypothetical protein
MEQESQPAPVTSRAERYHGFWPLLLMACSLILILSWEIRVGIFARGNAEQLREQQVRVVDQAKRVQSSLEKLVHGLVDLAKTDDAAKRIVTKYGIKIGSNAPSPAPSP